jgi:hypothetical protein
MRKLLAAAACLIAVAFATYLASPWIIEKRLEWSCSLSEPTDLCLVRMRAMGHVWSLKDNFTRAKLWYGRAAEHGDAASMFHLGWVYQKMARDAVIKQAMARRAKFKNAEGLLDQFMKVVRRLIDQTDEDGSAEASDGVPERTHPSDLELAAEWYRRSATAGFAPAMNNLGELYMHGLGGPEDLDAAFRWHMAAAQAGNPIGRWNVAVAYYAGHGVAADPVEAEKWLTWNPHTANPSDLLEPVLERTTLFGSALPSDKRALVRAAAKADSPVTFNVTPVKPDPSIPTFREVQRGVENK